MGFLSGALFLSSGSTPQIPREQLIPWTPIVLAFAFVPLTWYSLYRTPFGLRLRSVGENPEAADAAGVNVAEVRYIGVLASGVLAGIGGAYLSIGQSSLFTRNMTSGRGFIALAALIFGKWRPFQTMLACLFFGFTEAVTIQMQGVVKLPSGEDIPVQFIQMVPYVLTIVVSALSGGDQLLSILGAYGTDWFWHFAIGAVLAAVTWYLTIRGRGESSRVVFMLLASSRC